MRQEGGGGTREEGGRGRGKAGMRGPEGLTSSRCDRDVRRLSCPDDVPAAQCLLMCSPAIKHSPHSASVASSRFRKPGEAAPFPLAKRPRRSSVGVIPGPLSVVASCTKRKRHLQKHATTRTSQKERVGGGRCVGGWWGLWG